MIAVPEVVVRRKLTFEDYCALPDDQDYEIIDGVLYVSPRARARHQRVANRLAQQLTNQVEDRGLGVVIPDADLIIDERSTYVSPDIMVFRRERYAEIDPDDFIRIVPDLVIEVTSPSTSGYDYLKKRETYARLGVPHYWIVDGSRRTVTECVLQPDGEYRTRGVAAPTRLRPAICSELELDLERLFQ